MADSPLYSFASGEWSPYLGERADLQKYAVACSQLQNMILMKYGSVRRRPGTVYVADVKDHSGRVRLIKFQASVTTTFVLELGNQYMRFFADGAQVESGGLPYEVATPYLTSQLRDIHVSQINDEMRFVHPDHPPYILRRLADTNWTFAEIEFTQPPVRDENLDESKTITPSATTGSGITLTASGFTFDEDVVGGYYRIGYARDQTSSELQIKESNNNTGSTPLSIKGDWQVTTFGTWDGLIYLQRRVNGGAWQNLRSWSSDRDANFADDGTELEDAVEMRLFLTNYDSGALSDSRAILEVVNAEDFGVVKVTAVAPGGATATADVRTTIADTTATFRWAEGAWSTARGFPRTITLHESRVYYGGNESQAQTIWASDVDGYDRFTEEDLQDSDSFRITLGGVEYNAIQWLSTSPKNMLIGTTGGEWSLSSGDSENVLSGSSARIVRESELGSEHLQPVTANDVVLFTQAGGRDVHEIVYSFEQDGFINANLTDLAEHITKGRIREWSYQRHRDSIVWAITGEGNLVGLTYVRRQDVVGWHRHTTQGEFESVVVIGTGDEEEEVWVSVKRTINGATRRYIERFSPDAWRAQEDATYPTDLVYVDSAKIVAGTSTNITADHLLSETVSLLVDGSVEPNATMEAAGLTVSADEKVIVGLPFSSVVEPMPIAERGQGMTTQSRNLRIHEIVPSIYKTSVFQFGFDGETHTYYPRETGDALDTPPLLRTRKVPRTLPSRWGPKLLFRLEQDLPLPLTILGIIRRYRVEDNG